MEMLWSIGKVALAAIVIGIPVKLLTVQVKKVFNVKEELDKEIKEVKETYLTKDKHNDLCHIANLEIKEHISEEIKSSKEEILNAIKRNNNL